MSVGETSQLRMPEPGGAARPRVRMTTRFLRSELRIIFGRRRNQAGLGVLAVVPIVIAVAVKASSGPARGGGPDFFASIVGNGLFVALAALTIELTLFLPLAVAAISGDAVAGEANLGTLRYLLTVPVGRTRLLVVKFAAITIFAFAATLLVAVVGAVAGLILFGGGNMTLLSGSQISMGSALLRVLLTVAYLAAGLAALGAIGLFVSTLTEQPIAAMIAVVILDVAMFIIDSLPQLAWLHPWLLTHWWTSFGDFFRAPMAWSDPTRGLLTAAGYALVFFLAARARLGGKDITS
ncbi:ABC-2 type transport system permease protein [Nakamurella panacisegetis]|uniref:ABC-2 type transport system permease protein n=1 Tax=Nakamurella panacisegetis TaxID=1090615 RepID=A0A1H0KKX2_9ACTN|nr:ABC transporter permease subunit [Nakamurella panacisegetis]SDO56589.1 ABC-2 type transport system permease protein [Nakamurella panacisegetis]